MSNDLSHTYKLRLHRVISSFNNQRELARKSGVPVTTIRSIVSGVTPRFDTIYRIACAAGVSLDWIAGRDDAANVPPNTVSDVDAEYQRDDDVNAFFSITVVDGERRGVDYLRFRADYLRARLNINVSDLLLVPVDDDGAAPTLLRGGVCICHVAASAGDGLWALHAANGAFAFRRVFAGSRSVQVFRADASGEAQPIESMPLEDFHRAAVGRVVWGGERFFD